MSDCQTGLVSSSTLNSNHPATDEFQSCSRRDADKSLCASSPRSSDHSLEQKGHGRDFYPPPQTDRLLADMNVPSRSAGKFCNEGVHTIPLVSLKIDNNFQGHNIQ